MMKIKKFLYALFFIAGICISSNLTATRVENTDLIINAEELENYTAAEFEQLFTQLQNSNLNLLVHGPNGVISFPFIITNNPNYQPRIRIMLQEIADAMRRRVMERPNNASLLQQIAPRMAALIIITGISFQLPSIYRFSIGSALLANGCNSSYRATIAKMFLGGVVTNLLLNQNTFDWLLAALIFLGIDGVLSR